MIIGVPRETKRDEYRVSLLPVGAEELVRAGHVVLVERGAGAGSGLGDELYAGCGATLVDTAAEVFARADLVVKVKEPQPPELKLIRPGQAVFTYFHFAADRSLTEGFLATGATAIAYETLRDDRGRLPLLVPMSEVAGRMSIQEGAKYLEKPQMGRGILLGGVPGVAPALVTVLGAGTVGANAAKVAAGFGANVGLLDTNLERLRYLDDVTPPNIDCLFSDRHTIRDQIRRADLVIGSVLIPGARAPHLIEREDLALMKPGAVIIDVAIDQGGCVATSPPRFPTSSTWHRGASMRHWPPARRSAPRSTRTAANSSTRRWPRPSGSPAAPFPPDGPCHPPDTALPCHRPPPLPCAGPTAPPVTSSFSTRRCCRGGSSGFPAATSTPW
jgi:alanine dehydrogenase